MATGTPAAKLDFFAFSIDTPRRTIRLKFEIFARDRYPRFFSKQAASFHADMIDGYIKAYFGEQNFMNLAFRGSAKTSLAKLFVVFVLLNDTGKYRKYLKILTRDLKNAKQFVVDAYNLIVEVRHFYGNMFKKEGDVKKEETRSAFDLKDDRKLTAGTVGQQQRGHIQDAFRPDFVIFDDCEDSESVTSVVITQGIMSRAQEALDGRSTEGSYLVLGNYISDQGVMEWFRKKSVKTMITPILDKNDNPTWPAAYTKESIAIVKKDADDFYGEYMCDPNRSINKFFDIARLERDMKLCVPPLKESAGVKYWGTYKPNHRYGQGSDHSEGVGLDSNTLVGFDFNTGLLVYSYASNLIKPDMAVHEFVRVAMEFGNPVYAPETNNKCGGTAITTLVSLEYPRMYQHEDDTKARRTVRQDYGWSTNSKTKYTMFYEFRTDYNDGLIKILDIDVLKEMKAYTNADLTETALDLKTKHFDLLTAACIAWQMRKVAVRTSQKDTKKTYNDGYANYIKSLRG